MPAKVFFLEVSLKKIIPTGSLISHDPLVWKSAVVNEILTEFLSEKARTAYTAHYVPDNGSFELRVNDHTVAQIKRRISGGKMLGLPTVHVQNGYEDIGNLLAERIRERGNFYTRVPCKTSANMADKRNENATRIVFTSAPKVQRIH